MQEYQKIDAAFKEALQAYHLFVKQNNINDVLQLYRSHTDYAKLSGRFPVTMESVKEDIEKIPSITDKEHKFFLSIYNNEKLAAALDFIDGYSFQDKKRKDTVWIGLLLVDGMLRGKGTGTRVITVFAEVCRMLGRKSLQIGVIKENSIAVDFWKKQGFQTIGEAQTSEYDLFIMEKQL